MISLISRAIGPARIGAILREEHFSDMSLTSIPIASGAKISDHCVIEPRRCTLEIAALEPVATWNAIMLFQRSRIPFALVTGLTIYTNMVITRMSAVRDAGTGSVLRAYIDLQEVIRVSSGFVPVTAGLVPVVPTGLPGGLNSLGAANPTPEIVAPGVADRVSGTLQLGDAARRVVSNGSEIIKKFLP